MIFNYYQKLEISYSFEKLKKIIGLCNYAISPQVRIKLIENISYNLAWSTHAIFYIPFFYLPDTNLKEKYIMVAITNLKKIHT